MATSNAIINCLNGVMKLTFGNMTLELNIFHLIKKHMPAVEEDPEEVCLIDTILDEQTQLLQLEEELTKELAEVSEELHDALELCAIYGPWRRKEEILPLLIKEDSGNGGSIEPQKLDLKPLPIELKYAYLEKGNQCRVVISSLLNASQENSLLDTLRKYKQAIGWKISDLKGISPLVCTHNIYMEYEAKPVRQP